MTRIDLNSFAARGLDHGYALTAHAYQGHSIQNLIVGMFSGERLATQKALYVQLSPQLGPENSIETAPKSDKETALTETEKETPSEAEKGAHLEGRDNSENAPVTERQNSTSEKEKASSDTREEWNKEEALKEIEKGWEKINEDRARTRGERSR